jgi:hypothetical protein
MPRHIFFSWQSDTPNRVGRSLIEASLERAIGVLQADADIDPAERDIAVDRDTRDVPGSPPIMETIFGKIDRAAVFLSDLTYVAERVGGGRTPNPNVCIEHGWALKALSWRRVIAVMNTAMGHPDEHELPFDVRHTRRPIFFLCPADADADARREASSALTKQLVTALKAIFSDAAARSEADAAIAVLDPRREEAQAALQALAFDGHRGTLPEIVTLPRVTLRLAPFCASEGRRIDPRQVMEMQIRFPLSTEASVKAESDGRQWWSCAPPRRWKETMNPETAWRMRLVRPGNLEYQATIGARIDNDREILVDGRRLEGLIIRALERMASIARGLGLVGPALVSVSLEGVEDVELTRARPGGRRIRQPEVMLPTAMVPNLVLPLAQSLHEQFDILWQTAGWPDGSPSFGGGAWVGYEDRQNYD